MIYKEGQKIWYLDKPFIVKRIHEYDNHINDIRLTFDYNGKEYSVDTEMLSKSGKTIEKNECIKDELDKFNKSELRRI